MTPQRTREEIENTVGKILGTLEFLYDLKSTKSDREFTEAVVLLAEDLQELNKKQ